MSGPIIKSSARSTTAHGLGGRRPSRCVAKRRLSRQLLDLALIVFVVWLIPDVARADCPPGQGLKPTPGAFGAWSCQPLPTFNPPVQQRQAPATAAPDVGAAADLANQGLQLLNSILGSRGNNNNGAGGSSNSGYCDDLASKWNDLMHNQRMPREFGRYLANQLSVTFGTNVLDPDKACGDGAVYLQIRRQTTSLEYRLMSECNRTFTDGNGVQKTLNGLQSDMQDEERDVADTSRKICAAANRQLQAAASPATTPNSTAQQQASQTCPMAALSYITVESVRGGGGAYRVANGCQARAILVLLKTWNSQDQEEVGSLQVARNDYAPTNSYNMHAPQQLTACFIGDPGCNDASLKNQVASSGQAGSPGQGGNSLDSWQKSSQNGGSLDDWGSSH
jgi:hypothetical protein